MIKKLVAGSAVALALAVTSPAQASTTISLSGSSTTLGSAGNVRQFSNGGITVQATAWSYNSSNVLQSAFLGAYANGLGVTNVNEGTGANNSHAVDNSVGRDFILLVFNHAVNISSAVMNPYSQEGNPLDNDASVSSANASGLFASPLTTFTSITASNAVFGTLTANLWNVNGNTVSPYSTSLNSAGKTGNVWLIGAARTNPDQKLDGFKLRSITVAAVPEPGTWAMMLIGFGAVGCSMRRRPKLLPQAA